ncbi:M23 family metallopeptidase [Natronoflexus pectinivorans]|uniref:Murein DD-endopeptidase MepM/ murein hydrolase activator NlpD n=1 Tax=Natronoflexus pectinivorans TaxID=682526 RepID=A0A4R2GLP2_9BACT|nr:peptidoglycan DD-metalloendopeptidase family protein [Natronoflexus pectinivorans]TCO09598.1 murein DD-endopeptidase MepM/ murein hydrolase activator NlpD [Natronoflexus pectinivorans]
MKKLIITSAVLVIIIISISIYVRHWRAVNDLNISLQDSTLVEELPPLPPPPMLYGFIEDSFYIEHGSVRRNQNLASILLANNVDYSTIHNLAENSRDFFDVRRIRAGNPYTVFFSPDSLRNPEWFVYEINNTDYLVMQLTDSLKIYRDTKPIRTVRKSGAGVLNSSLWNAMRANNLNPMLAIEMSEIYAWTVDFFGIERGDNFRILYDETYVDTVSVGISEVHAAHFVHKGRDFYAFRYKEDSVWSYFDEEGNSLRKAFLKAPLNFSRISSRFSNNRFHPVLRIYRPHHGVDYAAPAGTPVYAIGDGTIVARGWDNRGGGNFVRIRHNSVYTTVYMHLQGFARGLHKGQHVQQGQLIGYVGQTGLATGPHLDFRVFQNGQPVDPLSIEAPPVDPISEENMERYLEYIRPLKDELRQIPLSMNGDQLKMASEQ